MIIKIQCHQLELPPNPDSVGMAQVADGPWRSFGDEVGPNDTTLDSDDEPAVQGDEGGEGEVEAEPQNNRPENKSQLQKLRERFQNTVKLVAHLYCDKSLQDDLRMVSSACHPFMKEYSEVLELQKKGQARPSHFFLGLLVDCQGYPSKIIMGPWFNKIKLLNKFIMQSSLKSLVMGCRI